MATHQFQIPNQRRPEREWTKKLYIEHANRMIEHTGNRIFNERNDVIAECYRAYSCELTPKQEAANLKITQQYGYDLGTEYMIYPLVEMLVDQLVGEYISLPIRKKTYSINKSAINAKLDEKVKYIGEEIFRELNAQLSPEVGFELETEAPEIELPNDIEEFFTKNYKTLSEELGDDLIVHFLDVLKERRKIKTLLQDFLIGEQATALIEEKDGHPSITRTKFDETYVDLDGDEEIQTNINTIAHFPLMTKNEILNKYDLTEAQIKEVDEMFENLSQGRLIMDHITYNDSYTTYQNCKNGTSYNGWIDNNSTERIKVMKMLWKSRKEIRAKVHVNPNTGEKEYTLLKKDYKPRSRDTIETTTIEVIRYVEMLGPEICLKYGEYKDRMSYVDNKKKVQLPVIHLRGRNTMYSKNIRSVASKVLPLQTLASNILFELRLSIKANNGRVLVYDVSQMPKQFLDTYGNTGALNRMLHHIKKDKILIFNSKDKQSRATFNQFTALDLTNRGQTQDLINALVLIEDLGRKFVGLNKERQGDVNQYQTATGTEKAVSASNARTEIYFNPFDEYIQGLLNIVLMKSKHIYKAGQVFSYVFGDMMSKFLTIYQEFFNNDIGVYIGDRFKDKRDKEIIDQAAVRALGNATEKELILDLINVLEKDTASESKAVLERGLAAYNKLQAENAKALAEQEKAKQAHEQTLQDKKDQISREGFKKDIAVAKIYADNKAYTENQKNTSQELQTAAKLQLEAEKEALKAQADKAKKESKKD